MLKCPRGNFSLVFASIIGFIAMTVMAASAQSINAASVTQSKCTRCHSYAIVKSKIANQHPSENDWMMTIDKMKNAGLQITAEEQAAVAKYLSVQK